MAIMYVEKTFKVTKMGLNRSTWFVKLIKEQYSGRYRFHIPATNTFYAGEFDSADLALNYFDALCHNRDWNYEEV